MTRLILVTFAALGWSFYVMSGGPDFEPRGLRSEQPVQVAAVAKPVTVAKPKAEELVTNVATRATPIRVQPKPTDTIVAADVAADPANLSGFSRISTFDGQGASFTLASLEDGAAGLQQVAPTEPAEQTAEPEPVRDIREISGTRVNLRDGPGTIYPIIGKAQLGQQVEVLGDSGTGWLRLRVLPVQQVGWISESLIRKTTN
ncbi:SH3 domain-containing protein [Ruegeria sp.]|uniref:SH3 domain-containing protein n=1 Tax=Ruegeria sp. TaxID=1879320 RepID=UPI00232490E6|nr:SH3 domain-containing protein [Ruegeria sp.]MDA7967207.1 SH3 domain-containing protein [Ruegeria sp.]